MKTVHGSAVDNDRPSSIPLQRKFDEETSNLTQLLSKSLKSDINVEREIEMT